MNRRTFIASAGTALGGLGAGTILMNHSTDSAAAASVSMGTLEMSNDNATTDDGNISNVAASVSGTWEYELPAQPTEWLVQLRVSDGQTWAVVGQDSGSLEYAMMDGEYTVSGSVTETSIFDVSYFSAPEPGKEKIVELPFQVWFRVLDGEGTAMASQKLDETATVTVAQESIDASLYGEVMGSGGVTVEK